MRLEGVSPLGKAKEKVPQASSVGSTRDIKCLVMISLSQNDAIDVNS